MVAAIDAMITGDALMLSAATVGLTDGGRFAASMLCSISARVSLTSVPNENCAMTSAIELADVDWRASRRGAPEIARSIGLVTCSATSAAPAPGSGAITVITGSSMSGRSSCWRLPQAAMPAMNTAAASSSVTLRLATANSERRLMRVPFGWTGSTPTAWSAARARMERLLWMTDQLVVVDAGEEVAHLVGADVPEAVEEGRALLGQRHHDLAAVGGIVAAGREALVDDPVDEAADGGQRDAEPGHEVGHVELADRAQQVQDLRLRHGHGDLEELGRVDLGEAAHERVVAGDDGLDGGDALGGIDDGVPLVSANGSLRPNHSADTIHRMASVRSDPIVPFTAGTDGVAGLRRGGIITGGARRATRVAPAHRREVMTQRTGRLRGGASVLVIGLAIGLLVAACGGSSATQAPTVVAAVPEHPGDGTCDGAGCSQYTVGRRDAAARCRPP